MVDDSDGIKKGNVFMCYVLDSRNLKKKETFVAFLKKKKIIGSHSTLQKNGKWEMDHDDNG